MKTHKNLNVWQKAIDFVTIIYKETNSFPKSELYGLTNQIRRSAVSIPSNIAEGAGRTSRKEFSRFLSISIGSASELETQLIISKNLEFINDMTFERITKELEETRKMTIGLMKSLDK